MILEEAVLLRRENGIMRTDLSPTYLTYHMLHWDEVKQFDSDQKCTECGRPLKRTEPFTDKNGTSFEGYVCHSGKRVTWIRID